MDYSVNERLFEKIGNALSIYERDGVKSHDFRPLIAPQRSWKEVLIETVKQKGDNRKALENLGLLHSNLDALMILGKDSGNTMACSLSYYLRWGTVWRPINLIVPEN